MIALIKFVHEEKKHEMIECQKTYKTISELCLYVCACVCLCTSISTSYLCLYLSNINFLYFIFSYIFAGKT
jgi:hypothetical protein